MPKNLRYYCYFTPQYKAEADKMYPTFAKNQIHVNLVPFGTEGDWMLNCLKRPSMLHQAMLFNMTPVCLLDSDLECLKPPILLEGDFDVACEFRGPKFPEYRKYSAGIVAFNTTDLGIATLEAWKKLCDKDPEPTAMLREQLYLRDAITYVKPRFLNLPNSYNAKPEQVKKDTVIIHNVASRRIKKEKKNVGKPKSLHRDRRQASHQHEGTATLNSFAY